MCVCVYVCVYVHVCLYVCVYLYLYSMYIILDIIVGFTEAAYTFNEGDSGAVITLSKDSGIISERTDIAVNISLSGSATAEEGTDFIIPFLDLINEFNPEQQSIDVHLKIINDQVPEGQESFTLRVINVGVGFGFPTERQDTFETTEIFINDISSKLTVTYLSHLYMHVIHLS